MKNRELIERLDKMTATLVEKAESRVMFMETGDSAENKSRAEGLALVLTAAIQAHTLAKMLED